MASSSKNIETLSGKLVKIRVERDNWFAGVIYDGTKNVSVSTPVPCIPPIGSLLTLKGEWQDTQYGKQFKAQSSDIQIPDTREGVLGFLQTVPNIGPIRARLIVDRLGDNAIKQMVQDPSCIKGIGGMGEKQAESAVANLRERKNMIEAEAILAEMGFGMKLRQCIAKEAGDNLRKMIDENPYRLLVIEGVTFYHVDSWVLKTNRMAIDDPLRVAAVVVEALKKQEEQGHTWADAETIIGGAKKLNLARPVPYEALPAGIDKAIEEEMIVPVENGFGLRSLVIAENNCFKKLTDLLSVNMPLGSVDFIDPAQFAMLTPEQRSAVENAINNRVSGLTGGPGTGKCLAPGTPVLMYDGSIKAIELVEKGDYVMGDDSQPRLVTGTSHGWSQMFDLVPSKGQTIRINENHIITYRLQRRKKTGGKEVSGLQFDTHNTPVQEFVNLPTRIQEKAKLFRVPVSFDEQELPIDPYFIGLWLGDGTTIRPEITSADDEVVEYLYELASAYEGLELRHVPDPNRPYQYVFTTGAGSRRNPITSALRDLGVLGNKHIPSSCKVNSENNRLQVLAGLLDADGSLSCGGFEITTKYYELSQDILFLARSLGFAAYSKPKYIAQYPDNTYYRIFISGDCDRIPVKIERKKAPTRQQMKNVLHTGFKVHNAGYGEYYGIEVDGNHLHVLGDFTVVHNTFTSKTILAAFPQTSIAVVAPTGKAAKRASEVTGYQASTIHRFIGRVKSALAADPPQSVNSVIPQVILVDETSMVDIKLFSQFLSAVTERDDVRIIIVGDVDQLPSIGAGRLLGDLIECGKIPFVRLTQVMRQAGESKIVSNAYRINNGEMPDGEPTEKNDWLYGQAVSGDREAQTQQIIDWLKAFLLKRVKKMGFDPIKDVQILTGQRRTALGTQALNEVVREALNPPSRDKAEIRSKDGKTVIFREGDKVMFTSNDYELGVVNGDQGIIVRIKDAQKISEREVEVLLDSGEKVVATNGQIDDIVQAWVVTVHKSQGSEYPVVVTICHDTMAWALQRALFYTAVTRGKKHVVVFGNDASLQKAVKGATPLRLTRLGTKLATWQPEQ